MLFEKPNGIQINVADNKATIDYCKSLGWKEVKPKRRKKEVKE